MILFWVEMRSSSKAKSLLIFSCSLYVGTAISIFRTSFAEISKKVEPQDFLINSFRLVCIK